MVRVHFGPPLLEKEKEGLRPGRESTTRTQAKMDSKAGSWQQSGGLLQPAWLSRRKASPGPPLLKSWKLKIESWKLWTVNFQLLTFNWNIWGVSSAGRAPALQAGGHRFDPGTLHQRDWLKQQSDLMFHWVSWEIQRCTLKTEHYFIMMQLWEGNSKGKLLIKRVLDTILAKNF